MRRALSVTVLTAVLTTGLALSDVACAQSNPSVLQTIEALKPRPGKSRGSRPVVAPPAGDTSVSSAATPVVHAPSAPAVATSAAATITRPALIAAAPAAKPIAADTSDAPGIDFNVLFASGSADLTPGAVKSLDTIGQALASAELTGSKFRIEGHTDTVGSQDSNRALSARRAAAVVDFLSQKYAIDRSRLEARGMGQDALVVPTGDQVAEPRNRRVRVVNITG